MGSSCILASATVWARSRAVKATSKPRSRIVRYSGAKNKTWGEFARSIQILIVFPLRYDSASSLSGQEGKCSRLYRDSRGPDERNFQEASARARRNGRDRSRHQNLGVGARHEGG